MIELPDHGIGHLFEFAIIADFRTVIQANGHKSSGYCATGFLKPAHSSSKSTGDAFKEINIGDQILRRGS
jgi:hypothetical protein